MTVDPDRTWAREVLAKLASLPVAQASAVRLAYGLRVRDSDAAARLGISGREYRAAVCDGMRALAALLAADV